MSSAIGNFGKKIKVLIFTSPRNCIVYLGPHSEGTGEGGGETETDLEFCFYWDWGLDNKFADSLFNGEFTNQKNTTKITTSGHCRCF